VKSGFYMLQTLLWQAFLTFFSRAFGFRRESFWLRHKSFFYCLH